MSVEEQIESYIAGQPASKRNDLQTLHRMVQQLIPAGALWFLDGKNSEGKIVANPNIGYGIQTLKYADGKTKEFYQIGISANKTGISVYLIGLEDTSYLVRTYGEKIGKAKVTGYCIRFNKLADIDSKVLEAAIQDALKQLR